MDTNKHIFQIQHFFDWNLRLSIFDLDMHMPKQELLCVEGPRCWFKLLIYTHKQKLTYNHMVTPWRWSKLGEQGEQWEIYPTTKQCT